MPASKWTPQQLYDRLVEAYKKWPGQHVKAAKQAGCAYATARGHWIDGSPRIGRPPIRAESETVKKTAKADRALQDVTGAASDAAVELARDALVRTDAERTRASLAKLCEAAREVTLGNFAVIAGQLRAINDLNARIDLELKALSLDPWMDIEKDGAGVVLRRRRVTPREMLELQGLVALTASRLVRAAFSALQMERLHLGLPTAIVGVEEMSLEEAVALIETAGAELQQAKDKGLVVLQGGKSNGVAGG